MSGLSYEGPTGEALYANRYTMRKDPDSNKFTAQNDSMVSQSSSGSPMAVQNLPTHMEYVQEIYRTPPPVPQSNNRPEIPQRSPSRVLPGFMFEEFDGRANASR